LATEIMMVSFEQLEGSPSPCKRTAGIHLYRSALGPEKWTVMPGH
jgi:hypothetical protein